MAAKVIPSKDGKCLCGCGETCKPGRAFYSNACQKRHYRRKYAHVRTSTLTMSGFSPKRKAVEILDPKTDRHDWISLQEWKQNEQTYLEMGCSAIVKGQPTLL